MYSSVFPIVIAQDPAPRSLVRWFPRLRVFGSLVLKLNSLNPMGQDLQSWNNHHIDVLSYAMNFWGGNRALLETVCLSLYKKYGEYPYLKKCPSLFELKDELSKIKGSDRREAEGLNSLRNKINGLLLATNDLFDCQQGIRLDKIMSEMIPSVFEIPDGLGKDQRTYLILYLVSWIYLYKKSVKDNSLVVIFLDEASDIFGKKNPSDEVPYIIQNILVTCRQYGMAFIVSSQIYSQLNISIRANSFVKVVNNINLGDDLFEIDKSFLLKGEQRSYPRKLKLGEALVLDGRVPDPFLIKVPEFQRPLVTDEEVLMSSEMFRRNYPYIPRGLREKESIREEPEKKEPDIDSKLVEDLKLIAMDIKLKPFCTVTEHISNLGMSNARFNKTKKYGVLNKIFEEHSFSTPGRGGNPVLLVLLEAGYKLINAEPTKHKGKGSLEHQWYQWKVAQWYASKGYKTVIEEYVGKKLVDVYVEQGDERIAVEIELAKPKNLSNYVKDAEVGFSKVVIMVKDSKDKQALEKAILGMNTPSECQVILLQEVLYVGGNGYEFKK